MHTFLQLRIYLIESNYIKIILRHHGVASVGGHCSQQEVSTATASSPTSAYNASQDLTRTVTQIPAPPPPGRHLHSVHALTLTPGPSGRPMWPPKSQKGRGGGGPFDLERRREFATSRSRQCITSTVGWLAAVQGSMGFSPLVSVGMSNADLKKSPRY